MIEFIQQGKPVLATCAGLILLSRSHFNVLDVDAERNAYGRQLDSHHVHCQIRVDQLSDNTNGKPSWKGIPEYEGVFIRAPRIVNVGNKVKVLAERVWTRTDALVQKGHVAEGVKEAVAVQQNNLLALAFHPELTTDTRWHDYFIHMIQDKS